MIYTLKLFIPIINCIEQLFNYFTQLLNNVKKKFNIF